MDKKELAQWMERRGVGQTLSAWVNNELLGRRNYSDLESLATDGTATIKIKLSDPGKLKIVATETFEGKVKTLEQENRELKKTVKNQEKQIADLTPEVEAVVQEETEEVEEETWPQPKAEETPKKTPRKRRS